MPWTGMIPVDDTELGNAEHDKTPVES